MSRWSMALFLCLVLWGAAAVQLPGGQQADTKKQAKQEPQAQQDPPAPPEEDVAAKPQEFSFNPVKAKRDITVGTEYFKKGSYNAAASRFITATKWNDSNPDAWLLLGQTEEKRNNPKAAREAYERYLQLAPQAKNAAEIKKRLEKLKASR